MKKYILITVIGIILIAVYLAISSINQTMVYYLTVSEFLNEKPVIGCRINGKVVEGSIKHENNSFDYSFKISDGKRDLDVIYRGAVSDIFKDGIEVVVEGKYDKSSGVFVANNVITKCPSKYENNTSEKSYHQKQL
jgi:cytochrome c-type biogenesis protein CcmE